MPQLNAYLAFDRNCAEAVAFYARVLDAKVAALIRYRDLPDCPPGSPADADLIAHAYVTGEGFSFMAGDACAPMPYEGVKGVSMTLSYPTAEQARRVFDALAEGGRVTMAPMETSWADTFGMLTDRYGVPWGVNGGMKPMG